MVLKSNQARGKWGEETLRRVVEAAGMSAHCDFTEQTQAGENRPDLIVRLPGDRFIIVDAKVPDFDFLNALESADEVKRAEALAAHAAKLKATIKALADRDYPRQFPNALDYVVLFVPAESLFSAALEGDHDLIVWAAEQTDFAGHAGVAHRPAAFGERELAAARADGERAENRRGRAGILHAGGEVHRTLRAHPRRGKANDAFNDAVGSYERMVRPAGEKIQKLGGTAAGKELADVQPLDSTLRLPPET
jgi:DNA recombination protein RmuC